MNFEQSLMTFINKLPCSEDTKRRKENRLRKFGEYMKSTYGLPESWNLNSVNRQFVMNEEKYFPMTEPMLLEYFSHLRKQVTERVYNDNVTLIRQFCDTVIDQGILTTNPSEVLTFIRIPPPNMDRFRLSLEDVIKLLKAAASSENHVIRNYALVLALAASSIRIGELVAIKEDDLFLDSQQVQCFGKTNRRVRVLVDSVCEAFQNLIHDPLRINAIAKCKELYLFYSDHGGQLTTREANQILKHLACQCGITTEITTYWLRRSFASIALNYGLTPLELVMVFRHDDNRTIYRYLEQERRNDLSRMVDNSPVALMLHNLLRETIQVHPR